MTGSATRTKVGVVPVREIMRAIAVDRRLVESDRRVLGVLQAHIKAETGWCVRSQRKLADELGIDRVTVMRAIGRLTALGYVAIEHRRDVGGANVAAAYRLLLPADQEELFGAGEGVPPGVVDDSAPDAPAHPPRSRKDDSAPESHGDSTGTSSFERPLENTHSRANGPPLDGSGGRGGVAPDRNRRGRGTARPTPADGQRELLPPAAAAVGMRGGPRAPPPSRIVADWRPGPIDVAFARKHGLADDEIARAADRFVNHWLADGSPHALKRDWPAAWRTWVLIYIERRAHREEAGHGNGRGNERPGTGGAGRRGTVEEGMANAFATLRRRAVGEGG